MVGARLDAVETDEHEVDVVEQTYRRAAATVLALGGAGLVLDSRTSMPLIVRQWAQVLSAADMKLGIELDRRRFVE